MKTQLKIVRGKYVVFAVNPNNGKSAPLFRTGKATQESAKKWLADNDSLVNYWLNSASVSVQLADTKVVTV